MASPHLTLDRVSCALPDGSLLFSDLSESFDLRRTGLVGRNGVGKSVLGRIMAGELAPSSGRCLRSGPVHLLAQQVAPPQGATVASLAGVQPTLQALARIEAGSTDPADFDAVGDRWDLSQRLQEALARHGLAHLHAEQPAQQLSGGEAMRVALVGAFLSDADFLILDEPSNHLDRPSRQALIEQLRQWPRGLIVISHDRQLLDTLDRIVELSPLGLHSYGGNHSFYVQAKAHERQSALDHLAHCRQERQRTEQALRQQRERQERRQARGHKSRQDANQAKILLDRQKERGEGTTARLQQQHMATRQAMTQRVREAAQQVEQDAPIVLRAPVSPNASPRLVAELTDVELPRVHGPTRHINLSLGGRQRVGIVGPNGCGKSTLLQVLAGQLQPLSGTCRVTPATAYLDQRLSHLAVDQSVIEQLQAVNRKASQAELRTRLAQLGLDARDVDRPSGQLSGGERLKAALACALYADPPPQLVLLDEPGNHLDLPSLQALEAVLRSYEGALVVVSHDDALLEGIGVTDWLVGTERSWLRVEGHKGRG